jgi:carotenoid cleavage dioxygenase-like enzyme
MTALDEPRDLDDQLPFHMRGNYAPVPDEIEAFDLDVEGAIPPELNGRCEPEARSDDALVRR